MEAYLEKNGFARGLIIFAIPSYGVLFKCRANGSRIDMEFASFFALLRFIKNSLGKERIKKVRIHSSNAEFVFSFAQTGIHLTGRPRRQKMLAEYQKEFDISIGYIARTGNKALIPPTEYPSTPLFQTPIFKPGNKGEKSQGFKPIQKGLSI